MINKMADRANLRRQYSQQRRIVNENFRSSSIKIPVVGDDILYSIPKFRGVYSKGFVGHTGPNNIIVGPDPIQYTKFIEGIKNRDQSKINQVYSMSSKLVDVHCLFDIELEGKYKSTYTIPLAPSPTSKKAGVELLEVYAMALLRDFNFQLLDTNSPQYSSFSNESKNYVSQIVNYLNIANEDNVLGIYSPPTYQITTNNLFRGIGLGEQLGPYVSQFFYYEVAVGNYKLEQKYTLMDYSDNVIDISNNNFATKENYFKEIWNGASKTSSFPTKPRYIKTIRDLAIYINRDQIWEAFFFTSTFLLSRGVPIGFFTSSRATSGKFINLGPVDLYNLMMKATKLAMNSAWVWKWSQLRPRPEEMAYQVHLTKKYTSEELDSSVNFDSVLLNSSILTEISNRNNGDYLMPLAYSQGSPFHPSYPAGHATIAGAMCTILKAWFNCDWNVPAYIPDLSGQNLVPYIPTWNNGNQLNLNISDELDKLASNCSYSRDMAGIHYRSDAEAGLLLGENVAIDLLKDEVSKYKDKIAFVFRKRNGETIEIKNHNDTLIPAALTIYSTPIGTIGNPTQTPQNIFSPIET